MRRLERVLAATDGSEHGAWAVATGAALARRTDAGFEVVSVAEVLLLPRAYELERGAGVLHEDQLLAATRQKAEAQAREAGAPEAPVHVSGGLAAPVVTDTARKLAADLIVVGAHPQPAVARFLVGSTAERVMRLAHCPVLVATERGGEPFRRILAAVDLSPRSRATLETAASIAEVDDAEILALHVHEPLPPMLAEAALFGEQELVELRRGEFERLIAETTPPSGMESREREGHAGEEILEEAEEWDADLIVVGTHGHGFFNQLLLGSTSLYVLRHGQRATMVVPQAEGA
jgi:nucleotide-binding universal stress UspA family protein